MPCTQMCNVMGVGPQFITLRDPTNAAGGLFIDYAAVPSTQSDPFACPTNVFGVPIQRHWRVVMLCDPTVNGLVLDYSYSSDVVEELPMCFYTVYTKSSAACGTPVVPPVAGGNVVVV